MANRIRPRLNDATKRVQKTSSEQPVLEDLILGQIPAIPRVMLHNRVLAFAKLYTALVIGIALSGCTHQKNFGPEQGLTGGDAKRGQHLIYSYSCGSCHVIPGIAEANGTIGPPLQGFGSRLYIAGSLVNTPDNLSRWIESPQEVEPGTAMPDLGVTKEQAADMAAYLYTLR